jgi:excisionase family DNA binding protein
MSLEAGNSGQTNDSLVKVQDVSQFLGVSPRTVWRMIAEGQLQAVRIRRCTRVSRREVEALSNGDKMAGRS